MPVMPPPPPAPALAPWSLVDLCLLVRLRLRFEALVRVLVFVCDSDPGAPDAEYSKVQCVSFRTLALTSESVLTTNGV